MKTYFKIIFCFIFTFVSFGSVFGADMTSTEVPNPLSGLGRVSTDLSNIPQDVQMEQLDPSVKFGWGIVNSYLVVYIENTSSSVKGTGMVLFFATDSQGTKHYLHHPDGLIVITQSGKPLKILPGAVFISRTPLNAADWAFLQGQPIQCYFGLYDISTKKTSQYTSVARLFSTGQ